MSTLFRSENLERDYISFEKTLFKAKKNKYSLSSQLKVPLKKYHRLTYVIALYDAKLKAKWQNQYNKFLFVSEILSDLLSNSVISIIGFYNSSKILTRRLIENFYNHIFYFDHPIEYELLNLGKNEYTPIIDLKKYYAAHPIIVPQLERDENIKNFNEDLLNHYHELCKHVHTKGIEFMDLATNLSEITPEIDIVNHFELINKSILEIIYLLYKFHVDISFTMTERALIATTFNKPIRQRLSI